MENEKKNKMELNNQSGQRKKSKKADESVEARKEESFSKTKMQQSTNGQASANDVNGSKQENKNTAYERSSTKSRVVRNRVDQREEQLQHQEEESMKNKSEDKETKNSRDAKRKEREKEREKKKRRKGRIRLIPVWVKVIVFAALLTGSLIAGAMFGYGFVGEGQEPRDVLDREFWYRIYDFIYIDTEMERTEDMN